MWTQINKDAINKYLPFAVKTCPNGTYGYPQLNGIAVFRCLSQPFFFSFFVLKSKNIQFLILKKFQDEKSTSRMDVETLFFLLLLSFYKVCAVLFYCIPL